MEAIITLFDRIQFAILRLTKVLPKKENAPFTDVPFTVTTTGITQVSFKDGKLHGEELRYYENGQLWSKYNYVNGELHGEEVWYHEYGQLKYKGNYVNGKLLY